MIAGLKKTLASNILFLILAMGAFWVGADLREFGPRSSIGYNTVFSFYFDRSSRLLQGGEFPHVDQWGFGPTLHEENTPPFLAYTTVWLHKMFNLFRHSSFETFADIFPILVYGMWFLSVVIIFSDLWNRWIGLAMGAVFSFLPVSIELTKTGSYFEELLGNWFLFLSIYFLIKVTLEQNPKQWRWLIGGVIAITGLVLSWQQFPVFYGAAILAILLSLKIGYSPECLKRWGLVLGLPLLLAYLITIGLVGNDYSPLSMLNELIIGFLERSEPDLLLAMQRADWADLTWGRFYGYFGWLGIVLMAMGFLGVLFDFKNFMKRTAGIVAAVGLLVLLFFVKDRFLAMSMSLPLMALGFNTLFVPEPILVTLQLYWRRLLFLYQIILQSVGSHRRVIAMFIIIAAIGIVTSLFLVGRYAFPPEPVIRLIGLENPVVIGETKQIEIVMENAGGSALRNKYAFAGLHVEIENAHVQNIESRSEGSKNQVIFKDFSSNGRFFFFEIKSGFLDAGERVRVTFDITPYAEPVRIYYRGWIPGPCPKEEQKAVIKELLPGWQRIDKDGWRNENCIRRAPALTGSQEPICRVPVFAAHRTLQDFRCYVVPDN